MREEQYLRTRFAQNHMLDREGMASIRSRHEVEWWTSMVFAGFPVIFDAFAPAREPEAGLVRSCSASMAGRHDQSRFPKEDGFCSREGSEGGGDDRLMIAASGRPIHLDMHAGSARALWWSFGY